MNEMVVLTSNQKRALNYHTHLSVTANAGSGKTFILTKRFIDIILNEDVSLNEIAAITFTEKAASELYNKIARALDEAKAEISNSGKLNKIENLRRQLISANISTIHSFCADLLRQYPVEANIDAAFNPIDANVSDELIDLSIEEIIQGELNNSETSDDTKRLIRLFGNSKMFAKSLKELFDKRHKIDQLASKLYSMPIEEAVANLQKKYFTKLVDVVSPEIQIFKSALGVFITHAKFADELVKLDLNTLLSEMSEGNSVSEDLANIKKRIQIIFTDKLAVRKNFIKAIGGEQLANAVRKLESTVEILDKIDTWDAITSFDYHAYETSKLICDYFVKTYAVYEQKKYEAGMLDYEDLLIKASSLLQNVNVQTSLSERFKYLMIDEYQDTNLLQYEIFIPILDELRKGNLFVVGDEKQSIYRFREAELEVFSRTKKMIESTENADAIVTLPESFRMSSKLCAFNNLLFESLFNNPNKLYNEVEYTELICARNDKAETDIEFLINKSDNHQLHAEMIANKILQLRIDKNVSFSSIAILSPKRKHFSSLEKELLKKNIPFTVVGGIGFYQVQLVLDIYNLFSFLLNNENDAALIGILRSPFFFFSDRDIYLISLQSGETYWKKLNNFSKQNESAMHAYNILLEFTGKSNSNNPISLIREITAQTNFLSVYSSRHDGELNLSNFEKLISISRTFFSQGSKTLYDYVEFLDEAITTTNDEGQAAILDSTDTVKIMTIHQAKGLQFENVFIAACHETPRTDSTKAKSVNVDDDFGVLTKVPIDYDYFHSYQSSAILSLYDFIEKQKELAEYKRLLYVAVTRPQNRLYICGSLPKDNLPKNSFLKYISDSLNIDLNNDEKFEAEKLLKFAIKEGDAYKSKENFEKIVVPILRGVSAYDPLTEHSINSMQFKTCMTMIDDEQEEEIISATKVAIFNECPTKYYLTYELGFSPLLEFNSKKIIDHEVEADIDDTVDNIGSNEQLNNRLSPAFRGELIHKILELDLKHQALDSWLENHISSTQFSPEDISVIKNEINNLFSNYYKSNVYAEISQHQNFKTEFQIYLKEDDYFLFGIIDRLIVEDDFIWIIDYKTDKINLDASTKKQARYRNQLNFYALLAAKYFPNITQIRTTIIFLEFPEYPMEFQIDRGEAMRFSEEVFSIVSSVRKSQLKKNLLHCKDCFFSNEINRCILE